MLGNDGELGDEGLEPVLGGVGDQPDNLGRGRLQALLNIELDLQSLFGLLCTAKLIGG